MNKLIWALLISLVLVTVGYYYYMSSSTDTSVTDYWKPHDANSQISVDHSLWQNTLDDYVITDDESGVYLVDYEGAVEDGFEDLTEYLELMSEVNPHKLNREEQFAYWVNLYNALTVDLILKHYPISSITKIAGPTLVSFGPWDNVAITINDRDLTLNNIEHDILRPIWNDYRIHFAVNCASIGCPNLQADAFTSANTQQLLDLATRQYLNHSRGLLINEDSVLLSSIFDWYQVDFGNSKKAAVSELAKWLEPKIAASLEQRVGEIKYDYDWSLNQAN